MAARYDQTLVGKRIKLLAMPEDPHPIPAGTTGTVRSVHEFDDWAQIYVDWDIKRNLILAVPPDEFEVLPDETVNTKTVFVAEHPTDRQVYIVERQPTRGGALNRWAWSRRPRDMPKGLAPEPIVKRLVPRLIQLQAKLHFIRQDLPDGQLDADRRSSLANARDALADAASILRTDASTPTQVRLAITLQDQAGAWMNQAMKGDQ